MDYRARLYERYVTTQLAAGDREILQTDSRLWEKYFRKNYLKHLPPDKTARILDAGCGMGQFLEFLRVAGYQDFLGIDRGDEAIRYCRARNLTVEKSDLLEHLGAHENTYDAIVLNDIIEHFTKSEICDVVENIYKALRPNGVVLIKTANAANPITGAHSMAIDLTHEFIFSEESLNQVLSVFGFRDIRILPLNIYVKEWNPIHWAARAVAAWLNLWWRILFVLYGRTSTHCFAKNILAVGRKIS